MKLQTKCTLVIVGLLIVEILPVPVTSLYSLYAIRKRPRWISEVTRELYEDKAIHHELPANHDPLLVRKNCTIGLTTMFLVDLLVPVVIPTALYVVRRQPVWFKKLVDRLYSDLIQPSVPQPELDESPSPIKLQNIEQQMEYLDKQNRDFVRSKIRRKHHPFFKRKMKPN